MKLEIWNFYLYNSASFFLLIRKKLKSSQKKFDEAELIKVRFGYRFRVRNFIWIYFITYRFYNTVRAFSIYFKLISETILSHGGIGNVKFIKKQKIKVRKYHMFELKLKKIKLKLECIIFTEINKVC